MSDSTRATSFIIYVMRKKRELSVGELFKEVSEMALKGIVAHTAKTYLIGDENVGGIMLGKGIEFSLRQLERLVCVGVVGEEDIGEPECNSIYDGDAASKVVAAQIDFFFNIRPLRTASLLMTAHPIAELIVPNMGGGHIDRIRAELQCQLFGLLALARALAARYQNDSLHWAQTTKKTASSTSRQTAPHQSPVEPCRRRQMSR